MSTSLQLLRVLHLLWRQLEFPSSSSYFELFVPEDPRRSPPPDDTFEVTAYVYSTL